MDCITCSKSLLGCVTRKCFWLETSTFLHGCTLRLLENGKNRHKNVSSSKTLSSMVAFENPPSKNMQCICWKRTLSGVAYNKSRRGYPIWCLWLLWRPCIDLPRLKVVQPRHRSTQTLWLSFHLMYLVVSYLIQSIWLIFVLFASRELKVLRNP